MKPAQERNQECLPPKKRELPVSNNVGGVGTGNSSNSGNSKTGGLSCASGGNGEDDVISIEGSPPNTEIQGGVPPGEWLCAQPGVHYGLDSTDGIPAVPIDQYSMLYKVALPPVTYSPTSPHPVLSHVSPAYTVHSPLLHHPGLSYPPLGYTQIPHSSLQFVSSPYAAVPYALPPGFVPSSLISPSGTIPQPHTVSHVVPYPSVLQEGVVSPPPQAQMTAHPFAKVAACSGIPLVLPVEQTAQQHLRPVGVIPGADLSSRGMSVFYHPQSTRSSSDIRDPHSAHQDREPEDASSAIEREQIQHGSVQSYRLEDRSSPTQRSTPDSDLEVQQVVGRYDSDAQSSSCGRKEISFAPLNLSQGAHKVQDIQMDTSAVVSVQTTYTALTHSDPAKVTTRQSQAVQPGHAVFLANGQPYLIPYEFHPQQELQHMHQHYSGSGQANDVSASLAPVPMTTPNSGSKASERLAKVCLPDPAAVEPHMVQQQLPQQPPVQSRAGLPQALSASLTPNSATCNPSHFMKGAIIQLATGELKRVEDLQTQDFVRSAEVSGGLKIDSSMVVDIRGSLQRPGLMSLHFTVGEQQSKVTIDVPQEHPFFVFGQGWSSCSPERTAQLYGLTCHRLQVGDVCVSITLHQHQHQHQLQPQQQKQLQQHHSPPPQEQQHQQMQQQQRTFSRILNRSNATSGTGHQLMGPPAPQQQLPQSHLRLERIHKDRQKDGERDRIDKDEAVQLGIVGHTELASRPTRTFVEHQRSHSNHHLHREGSACSGATMGMGQPVQGASQRRLSSPGLQRFTMKGEDGQHPQISSSGPARVSFIPQEVKLSIEGRSNAGK